MRGGNTQFTNTQVRQEQVEVLTSDAIRKAAEAIPPDRSLIETDNPGGYEWLARQAGMPRLLNVLEKSSQIRRMETVELDNQLTRNSASLSKGIAGIQDRAL